MCEFEEGFLQYQNDLLLKKSHLPILKTLTWGIDHSLLHTTQYTTSLLHIKSSTWIYGLIVIQPDTNHVFQRKKSLLRYGIARLGDYMPLLINQIQTYRLSFKDLGTSTETPLVASSVRLRGPESPRMTMATMTSLRTLTKRAMKWYPKRNTPL